MNRTLLTVSGLSSGLEHFSFIISKVH
jgi:hypothetical protein